MRFLLALLLVACGGVPVVGPIQAHRMSHESMVVLLNDEGRPVCAGVLVEEGILTAAHCVTFSRTVPIGTHDGLRDGGRFLDERTVRVLRVNLGADLALLERPAGLNATLPLSSGDPIPGEAVVTCGHPAGIPYVCHTGTVSREVHRFDEHRLWFGIDAGLVPGMSGGPVISSRGELLGINDFMLDGTVVGGVIAPETVRHFLENLP